MRLMHISGKVIKIEIKEFDLPFYIKFQDDCVKVLSTFDSEVHASMTASLQVMFKTIVTADGAEKLLSENVELSGDLELARYFLALLKAVDIDWEEILANYTGDVIAHQIGRHVSNFKNWFDNSSAVLRRDFTEYLQEETQLLPTRQEINKYLNAVDDVRMEVDRTSAKLELLRTTLLHTNTNNDKAN